MDNREKKILVISASAVLFIVVLFNVYRGITVSKIGVPGILEIEFNSGSDASGMQAREGVQDYRPVTEERQARQTEMQTDQTGTQLQSQTDQQSEQTTPPLLTGIERDDSQPVPEVSRSMNLTGTWYGEDGSEYEIEQYGANIAFVEYGLWGITATGSGTITGNQLVIDYQTSFGTAGKAVLNLSDNGQTMTGTASDLTTGATTALSLYKK